MIGIVRSATRAGIMQAAGIIFALALAACVGPQPAPAPILSSRAVVLEVPIEATTPVRDALYACGLRAISSLCTWYAVEVPPPLAAQLAQKAAEEHGLSGAELRTALESLGFEVFVFSGALDDSPTGLYHQVEARRPAIVMTTPGGGANHYSLFLGHDPEGDLVVLLDPSRGRVASSRAVFEREWEACRRFTLLALPRVATPAAPR
jgi:hypothetical protein